MDSILKKNNDSIDLLKFVMSIMVVLIHTRFYEHLFFPWLRIAVPVFFLISAYLFFSKLNNTPYQQKNRVLFGFVKRNLQFYLFYFIAFLPMTYLNYRDYFSDGFFNFIFKFFKDLLFGSTFKASWFIMALIIGVAIVFYLSKVLKTRYVLLITFLVFCLCALKSSYYNILPQFMKDGFKMYSYIFNSPVFSFPAALFMVAIGKCFAEGTLSTDFNRKKAVVLAFSLIALFAESRCVYLFAGNYTNDIFFSLALACPLIFLLFLNLKINIKYAKYLRKLSAIIYASHKSFLVILRMLLPYIFRKSLVETLILIAFCILFATAIIFLSKRKPFAFLKFAY